MYFVSILIQQDNLLLLRLMWVMDKSDFVGDVFAELP